MRITPNWKWRVLVHWADNPLREGLPEDSEERSMYPRWQFRKEVAEFCQQRGIVGLQFNRIDRRASAMFNGRQVVIEPEFIY